MSLLLRSDNYFLFPSFFTLHAAAACCLFKIHSHSVRSSLGLQIKSVSPTDLAAFIF